MADRGCGAREIDVLSPFHHHRCPLLAFPSPECASSPRSAFCLCRLCRRLLPTVLWSLSLDQASSMGGTSSTDLTTRQTVRMWAGSRSEQAACSLESLLGDVNFLSEANATASQLTFVDDAGHAIIKVDNTTFVPFNQKRNSVCHQSSADKEYAREFAKPTNLR